MGSMIPDKNGKVYSDGTIIRLALGMGFDANLTARENIYVNGSILGLPFVRIGEIFHDIIEFAEIEDFVDIQVKYFSSGMKSRLTFAIAIYADADILLMDEFFGGVGDINFKSKSHKIFENRVLEERTIIHVNHNLSIIEKYCDRVLVLHNGQSAYIGSPKEAIAKYKNLARK